jgi:hypothetical protein
MLLYIYACVYTYDHTCLNDTRAEGTDALYDTCMYTIQGVCTCATRMSVYMSLYRYVCACIRIKVVHIHTYMRVYVAHKVINSTKVAGSIVS